MAARSPVPGEGDRGISLQEEISRAEAEDAPEALVSAALSGSGSLGGLSASLSLTMALRSLVAQRREQIAQLREQLGGDPIPSAASLFTPHNNENVTEVSTSAVSIGADQNAVPGSGSSGNTYNYSVGPASTASSDADSNGRHGRSPEGVSEAEKDRQNEEEEEGANF